MREKLEHGRRRGRVGWDHHWNDCDFELRPDGATGLLMRLLMQEVLELGMAVDRNDLMHARTEAADVANFAMFVADIHGALRDPKKEA